MNFLYEVEVLNEINTAGICIETNCQKAEQDCVKLWHTFRPLMTTLFTHTGKASPGYGISVMSSNKNNFTYWTTVELSIESELPNAMQRFILPKREYLRCTVPTVNSLNKAYIAIGTEWLPQQKDYLLSMETPFFEVYKANWKINDPVLLYVPLKRIP